MITLEGRKIDDSDLKYKDIDDFGLKGSIKEIEDIPHGKLLEVSIKNISGVDFLGVIHVKLSIEQTDPKIFMPGFMYGRNTAHMPNHGRKEFPRLIMMDHTNDEGSEYIRPESDYFMTRSDRLAEPVSLIFDSGRIVGIGASPYWLGNDEKKLCFDVNKADSSDFYKYSGFTCRIGENGKASVGYTLGYEDAPWLFIQTATVEDRKNLSEENCFAIKARETVSFVIRVYDYNSEDEVGVHAAIRDVYETFHQEPRKIPEMTIQKATQMLSEAIRDYAWLEDDRMYTGFVYDKRDDDTTSNSFTYNKIGSLSWTNGLAVACPMLLAANRMQDDLMRSQALPFIEEVVSHSYNPASGLLYDAVENGEWSVNGWWYSGMHSGGHSSYLNGQAVYYILKAYLSERDTRRVEHDNWISFVEPVILKFNQIKNSDGEYPFSMSVKTGAGIEYDSLGGAWCLCATALFSYITRNVSYLDGLKKTEQHYYDTFVKKVECYGGPLDTDKAVDDEGILAYVRAVRYMHMITNEKYLLTHLRDGLNYEVSFKLGYNTPVKVKPLSDIGWSSCGGSITSTANPHIHPMSSTIIDEMIYYVRRSGDEYIESRLNDTILWGMQTFNTVEKEYGYGLPGWMSERFCFCQGLVVEKYPDGTPAGTWFALMPWASASIIEGYVGDCWKS